MPSRPSQTRLALALGMGGPGRGEASPGPGPGRSGLQVGGTARGPWQADSAPPTLELGNVSLKKVGSQDSRMKKEQAAENWEKMAALWGWAQLRPPPQPRPRPPGAQGPWESRACWLWGRLVLGTHGVCPIR